MRDGSYHYSGDGDSSRQFWGRVNGLPEPDCCHVYELGCILQELESRVLRALRDAEAKDMRKELKKVGR